MPFSPRRRSGPRRRSKSERRSSSGTPFGRNDVQSFTTSAGEGDARAPGSLARLLKSKNLPHVFARAEQVHGSVVRVVPGLSADKRFAKADGLLTAEEELPLAIFTADCVPIFVNG